jgi:hypothetical protein
MKRPPVTSLSSLRRWTMRVSRRVGAPRCSFPMRIGQSLELRRLTARATQQHHAEAPPAGHLPAGASLANAAGAEAEVRGIGLSAVATDEKEASRACGCRLPSRQLRFGPERQPRSRRSRHAWRLHHRLTDSPGPAERDPLRLPLEQAERHCCYRAPTSVVKIVQLDHLSI